jgi:RpiR family transcriptional regulator, carbohydrate utilization regulator
MAEARPGRQPRNPRSHGPISSVRARIESRVASLAPTSRRIAQYILEHGDDVVHMSVTEVAERTRASEGAVIKLCKQIGATGFQQLKISLAQDLVQPTEFIHEDLQRDDDVATVVQKIFHSGVNALTDTLAVLDPKSMAEAVRILLEAKRIELYGVGSSAPIAEDAYYRLLRIGLNAKVVIDSHIQAISASLCGPEVAVLTVSHSGSTVETVTAMRLAREAGARTICITNLGKSPIQAHSDVILTTNARETKFRTEAMTSRIAQLCIVDALIACLALANHDEAVAAIQHTFDVLSEKRY